MSNSQEENNIKMLTLQEIVTYTILYFVYKQVTEYSLGFFKGYQLWRILQGTLFFHMHFHKRKVVHFFYDFSDVCAGPIVH